MGDNRMLGKALSFATLLCLLAVALVMVNASTAVAADIDHYTVASTSYTQTAGVPFTVTITALDTDNATVDDNTTVVTISSTSTTMLFDTDSDSLFDDNTTTLTSGIATIQAKDTTAATGVTITATDGNDNTSIGSAYTINPGTAHHIVILPDGATITAGSTQDYTAEAFDIGNNSLGYVTSETTFFIAGEHGGSWVSNVYTSQNAGTWTVTGTYTTLADTATLTVNAGSVDHIVISPDNVTITAGNTQAYTTEAFDQFNNTRGLVTDNTSFSIQTGDGGSWASNVYTSRNAGTWTVTGTYNASFSDTATITVSGGAVSYYSVTSDNYTQQVTVAFTVTVTAYDSFGNLAAADNVTMTMSSSPSVLIFDGNGNGTYGETGDDVGILMAGTLDIPAKARSAADGLIITATDVNANPWVSEPYTVGDFRCFIATAAYGTPMIDHIQVLRDFRDGYLMTNPAGHWFVSTYYRLSPPLARFIAHHDSLRALVRVGLTPVIWLTTLVMKTTLLQKMAMLVSMIAAVSAAVLWLRRRRQSPTS
jgi:hypothetical protein